MTTQLSLASEPARKHADRFVPSYWKCVNWHNLLSQEGPLAGDVYNLGKIQSGKTTYLDGGHATFTGGDDFMAWNSAADPTSTAKSNPDGRRLKDIVCRVNDDGVQNPEGGISYFALELSNHAASKIVTICLGAQARSINSAIERWGMLIEKPLRAIEFFDKTGEVKGKEKLAQEYGASHVYARIGSYRKEVADFFFGGEDNFERVQRFWEMGKSYTRLLKEGHDIGALVRNVLPDPNPDEFDKTRSQIKDIRALDTTLSGLGVLQRKLGEIQGEIRKVTRARDRILRYDYAEKRQSLNAVTKRLGELAAAITATSKEIEKARGKEAEAERELTIAQGTLDVLKSEVDDKLLESARQLKEQQIRQATVVSDLGIQREARATAADKAGTAQTSAERALANALGEFSDLVARLTQEAPKELKGAGERLRRAAEAAASAETTDSQSLESAMREWRRVGDAEKFSFERRHTKLTEEHAALVIEGEQLLLKLRDLEAKRDIPPIENLDDALRGVEDKVVVVYRSIEPRLELDSVLLEQFLGPAVLAAVIPVDAEDTSAIKTAVHGRCPTAKVVERSELAEAGIIPPSSLLHALDPKKCHPLALQYLHHQYGDVVLLAGGTPRVAHQRVVWRDGQVYDGIAWQLARTDGPLQYVGREAARARLDAAKGELRTKIVTNNDAAGKKKQSMTSAKDALDSHAARLDSVELANTRLDADTRASNVRLARLATIQARADLQSKTDELEGARGILTTLNEQLAILDARLKATDMEVKNRQLQLAIEKSASIRKRKEDLIQARGKLEGHVETAQSEVGRLQSTEFGIRSAEQTALLALLPVATRAGYAAADIQLYLESDHIKGINPITIKDNKKSAEAEERDAGVQIGSLLNEAAKWRALIYDSQANVVYEASSRHDIERLTAEIVENINERIRERTQKLEELVSKQIIHTLVADMKRDRENMVRLIKRVNEVLGRTPFQGSVYQLKYPKNKDDPDIARVTNLVEEFSSENQRELALFIQSHLVGDDVAPGKVPRILDYRNWYKFQMTIERAGRESEVHAFVRKASGGGKALPHYLMCFGLFSVLYNSIKARTRLVFIDEAFRNMDADTIDDIIGFAKEMDLDLIVAAPELSGRTSRMENATVHMFAKDDATQEAHVRPLLQETL